MSIENARFVLREAVEAYGIVDVGKGLEEKLGISRLKLSVLLKEMVELGYKVMPIVYEREPDKRARTVIKVLARPEYTYRSIVDNRHKIYKIKVV